MGHERIFWSDGNVLYVDRGVGYVGICICENGLACTVKICAFI